jgi:LysR family transcriptional regulator, hydrogen peroxide-inducible genes activator
MEMHQVKYFLAVAAERNFTRAAQACNVSPPSLFRAIKHLEIELGGLLFNRERSRTHLTELGRIALPYIEQVSAAAHLTKSETARALNLDKIALNAGIMCTIAPGHFVELIEQFGQKCPHVTLSIIDGPSATLRSELIAGNLDVAIYAEPSGDADERLHNLPLFQETMVVAVANGHALSQHNRLFAKHLDGQPYLERVNCEWGAYGDKLFTDRGVTGPVVCKSTRDDWVLAMAAQGIGYAFIPETSAHHPGVTQLTVADMDLRRSVNIVTVRGRKHSPAVAAFLREVARVDWASKGVNRIAFDQDGDDVAELA